MFFYETLSGSSNVTPDVLYCQPPWRSASFVTPPFCHRGERKLLACASERAPHLDLLSSLRGTIVSKQSPSPLSLRGAPIRQGDEAICDRFLGKGIVALRSQ